MNPAPTSSRQLHGLLFRRLGAAAIATAVATSTGVYLYEARRADQAAFNSAATAASHFAAPAMQALVSNQRQDEHEHLRELLDNNRFIGIRLFDQRGRLSYETWEDTFRAKARNVPLWIMDPSDTVETRRVWIDAIKADLIQVVLPLIKSDGSLMGYLEGIYRIGQDTLRDQRRQIHNGVLTAALSVLVTAAVLYPVLFSMLNHATGLSRRLLDANLSLIRALTKSVAERDADTDTHNYRVTLYAVALAEAFGVPNNENRDLIVGALLHDVGKIGIPDHILRKPSQLSQEEFEVMKTHPILGVNIVSGIPWLNGAAQVIRHHHERFDGTGYPDGLSGTAIPRHARIFAVADVFDALTSQRPYKSALPVDEAIRIIEQGVGRHFDMEIVAAFRKLAPSLYQRIGQASEAELHEAIEPILLRCLKTEAAQERAASAVQS